MNEKYDIRFEMDNEYGIYEKYLEGDCLFKGNLEQVNAWISLREKGFEIYS